MFILFYLVFFLYCCYIIANVSNLAKLEFVALDISSENYLSSWILDVDIQPNAIRNKSLEILRFLLIVVNILKEHLVFEITKNPKRPLQEV